VWEQRLDSTPGQHAGPVDYAHNVRVVRTAPGVWTCRSQTLAKPQRWTGSSRAKSKMRERYNRITKLPLSASGRATTAAAYGVHRLRWHMQHGELPPEAAVDPVRRLDSQDNRPRARNRSDRAKSDDGHTEVTPPRRPDGGGGIWSAPTVRVCEGEAGHGGVEIHTSAAGRTQRGRPDRG
jgi:hypothetical protein